MTWRIDGSREIELPYASAQRRTQPDTAPVRLEALRYFLVDAAWHQGVHLWSCATDDEHLQVKHDFPQVPVH